jgi:multidrug resistance efflux pump
LYDPLLRLDKRDLVLRIRTLERELETERKRRGALAYDQQAVLAKILRLETELILLQPETSRRDSSAGGC